MPRDPEIEHRRFLLRDMYAVSNMDGLEHFVPLKPPWTTLCGKSATGLNFSQAKEVCMDCMDEHDRRQAKENAHGEVQKEARRH